MEGDEKIGLMLDRANRLRLKITDAIDVSGGKRMGMECDKEESLFDIREALESLEKQLASLQALQQRQRSEREAVLTQIDRSRKTLFIKLEGYKGVDIEVIHEAAAFANETVEQVDAFDSNNKPSKNSRDNESFMELASQSATPNKQKRVRSVWGFIAKSAISFVGVISVLSLVGFKPEIRRRDSSINVLDLLPVTAGEVREASIRCPPGKILVFEDGKASCLVKERVEIPFGSDSENSSINIAFG